VRRQLLDVGDDEAVCAATRAIRDRGQREVREVFVVDRVELDALDEADDVGELECRHAAVPRRIAIPPRSR